MAESCQVVCPLLCASVAASCGPGHVPSSLCLHGGVSWPASCILFPVPPWLGSCVSGVWSLSSALTQLFSRLQGTGKWYELQDLQVTDILPQMITLSEAYIQVGEGRVGGGPRGSLQRFRERGSAD